MIKKFEFQAILLALLLGIKANIIFGKDTSKSNWPKLSAFANASLVIHVYTIFPISFTIGVIRCMKCLLRHVCVFQFAMINDDFVKTV